MQGKHAVKTFPLTEGMSLPPGWKPFGVIGSGINTHIVCRKWERLDG